MAQKKATKKVSPSRAKPPTKAKPKTTAKASAKAGPVATKKSAKSAAARPSPAKNGPRAAAGSGAAKSPAGKSVQKRTKKRPASETSPGDSVKTVACEVVDSEDTPPARLKTAAPKAGPREAAPVRKVENVEILHPDDEDPEAGRIAGDFAEPIEDDGEVREWNPEPEIVEDAKPARTKKFVKPKTKNNALVPVESKDVTTTKDSITAYLNEIRRYPLLTKEQEQELARRYFETKDPAAAQALVTANLRFVVKVAAEYSKYGARLIDLIQEGNMGLMHAVRDFNPYKGVRLITYAVWWIRGYIQEYLLKQYSMVKIATTQNQKRLFYRLQKEKELLDSMGETPDMKLIGERMGIPTEEVEQMANRLSGRDISLNAPLDDTSSSSLMDMQRSTDTGIDDQLAAHEEVRLLREKLEEMRDQLSERERIILDERLLADEPLTLQEIGEKHGITREAVRQMEARLMKKIRDQYMASLTTASEDSE